MKHALTPRIAPLVDFIGAQGWIVLGLAAGAAIAWRLTRDLRPRHRRPHDLGRWEGEAGQPVDTNTAIAS